MDCQIIRSDRRSFSLQVKGEKLVVRVPMRATEKQIRDFISQHEEWIRKHLALARSQKEAAQDAPLTEAELLDLKKKAQQIIPQRTAFFAEKLGVTYGRISIRHQRTRWGSCSAEGNLNFNCLLMLAPPEVLDSVVVHELCHRLEMNHSQAFYRYVYALCPDYKQCRAWLKANGPILMARLPEAMG